jgi:hypothetical protein
MQYPNHATDCASNIKKYHYGFFHFKTSQTHLEANYMPLALIIMETDKILVQAARLLN